MKLDFLRMIVFLLLVFFVVCLAVTDKHGTQVAINEEIINEILEGRTGGHHTFPNYLLSFNERHHISNVWSATQEYFEKALRRGMEEDEKEKKYVPDENFYPKVEAFYSLRLGLEFIFDNIEKLKNIKNLIIIIHEFLKFNPNSAICDKQLKEIIMNTLSNPDYMKMELLKKQNELIKFIASHLTANLNNIKDQKEIDIFNETKNLKKNYVLDPFTVARLYELDVSCFDSLQQSILKVLFKNGYINEEIFEAVPTNLKKFDESDDSKLQEISKFLTSNFKYLSHLLFLIDNFNKEEFELMRFFFLEHLTIGLIKRVLLKDKKSLELLYDLIQKKETERMYINLSRKIPFNCQTFPYLSPEHVEFFDTIFTGSLNLNGFITALENNRNVFKPLIIPNPNNNYCELNELEKTLISNQKVYMETNHLKKNWCFKITGWIIAGIVIVVVIVLVLVLFRKSQNSEVYNEDSLNDIEKNGFETKS